MVNIRVENHVKKVMTSLGYFPISNKSFTPTESKILLQGDQRVQNSALVQNFGIFEPKNLVIKLQ